VVKILPSKESWNRYHPQDVRMQCANTRTTWDKWGICREFPPHGRGIHRRKGIPPGITSSETRKPPEEGDSTGNYQLIYADSGR
jgi:hypothetical protein